MTVESKKTVQDDSSWKFMRVLLILIGVGLLVVVVRLSGVM